MSTETNRLSDVTVGVISNAVFFVLLLVGTKIWSVLTHHNPVWKLARLAVIVFVGLLLTVAAIVYLNAAPGLTISIFFLIVIILLAVEIRQFWRVGLVGVDAEVSGGIDYARALGLCTSSLEFLGIGASKLTENKDAFEQAIDRCDRPDRSIRFLLCRPDSVELERIALMAGRDRSEYSRTVQESLRVIARLRNEREKNIEVRFYQEFPAFRLMFTNDVMCLTSYYVLGKGSGSNLPQLQIVRTPSARDINSLYYAFSFYFSSIWQYAEEWDFERYL